MDEDALIEFDVFFGENAILGAKLPWPELRDLLYELSVVQYKRCAG